MVFPLFLLFKQDRTDLTITFIIVLYTLFFSFGRLEKLLVRLACYQTCTGSLGLLFKGPKILVFGFPSRLKRGDAVLVSSETNMLNRLQSLKNDRGSVTVVCTFSCRIASDV